MTRMRSRTSTWSRSTSGTCGGKSTRRSAANPCKRYAGLGTCWRATVADAFRWAGQWWLGHGLGPLLVRWWRRRGLRARVTMIAALGLIVAFILIDLLLF